jgi:hypothetical protein
MQFVLLKKVVLILYSCNFKGNGVERGKAKTTDPCMD